MQTILGAGGAIGTELAKALAKSYTNQIRLVSRDPKKVNPEDELFPADLLDPAQVHKAVENSTIVYVTVGFPYSTKVWKESWPRLIQNTLDACKTNGSKLVFFDNIYMYDKDFLDGMTEETPIKPPSEKGKVRSKISQMLMEEIEAGKLTALIARSADFYGPSIKRTSMLTEMVFKKFAANQKANWLGSLDYKHSFTYTPDAGKATAMLGNTEDAYNQAWHLPTAPNPYTGKEWITTIAEEMGVKPKYQKASKFMVQMLGIFIPIMREMVEMVYQYDRNYVFDSSKFENRFNFTPTPYLQGIREIIQKDYEVV